MYIKIGWQKKKKWFLKFNAWSTTKEWGERQQTIRQSTRHSLVHCDVMHHFMMGEDTENADEWIPGLIQKGERLNSWRQWVIVVLNLN